MGLTLVEKILARASMEKEVAQGDIVNAEIDIAMIHDSLGILTIKSFLDLPIERVWDPEKIVVIFDHKVPATNMLVANSQSIIRRFVNEQGITNFYDIGRGGICHQVLHEKGHIVPGNLIVGTDSHTTTHGAFGAMAVGIGSTEMTKVFATGELWFKVPKTVRIRLEGALQEGVMGKDVILFLLGSFGVSGATYMSVEYAGSTIREMSVAGRLTMCNMSAEMGAKNAIIAPDTKTISYLRGRVKGEIPSLEEDNDAEYFKEHDFDCAFIEPFVAVPPLPSKTKPVTEVDSIEIDQAFIGSCTNGRLEDLRAAARVLGGRKVADGVRLIIIPASQEVWIKALTEGLLKIFVSAGAAVCTPSCGPCTGADKGLLGPNEICVATTNRNFIGRMGDLTSQIYLANPYTVAASAITGRLTDPRQFLRGG